MATKKAADNNNFDWSVEAFRRRRDEGARRAATTSSAQTGETDFDWSVEAFRRRRDAAAGITAKQNNTSRATRTASSAFSDIAAARAENKRKKAFGTTGTKKSIDANAGATKATKTSGKKDDGKNTVAAKTIEYLFDPRNALKSKSEKADAINDYIDESEAKKVDLNDPMSISRYMVDSALRHYDGPRTDKDMGKAIMTDGAAAAIEKRKQYDELQSWKYYNADYDELRVERDALDASDGADYFRRKYGDDVGDLVDVYFSYDDAAKQTVGGQELKSNIAMQISDEDAAKLDGSEESCRRDELDLQMQDIRFARYTQLATDELKALIDKGVFESDQDEKFITDLYKYRVESENEDARQATLKKYNDVYDAADYSDVSENSKFKGSRGNGGDFRNNVGEAVEYVNTMADKFGFEPDELYAEYPTLGAGKLSNYRISKGSMLDQVGWYFSGEKAEGSDFINGVSRELIDLLPNITRGELDRLNYFYNTQGDAAALEYLKALQPDLESRNLSLAQRYERTTRKLGMPEWVGKAAAAGNSVLLAPVAGWEGYSSVAHMIAGADVESPIASARKEMREYALEDTSGVGRFAAEQALQVADNVVRAFSADVLGGASGAIDTGKTTIQAIQNFVRDNGKRIALNMSGEVASNQFADAQARGLSYEQSVALALLGAATEYFVEQIGFESFLKNPKSAVTAILNVSNAEGLEEVVSGTAYPLYDAVIAGDQSQLRQRVLELKTYGKMSEKDAQATALCEYLSELGYEYLGGLFAGALMGGGAAISTNSLGKSYNTVNVDEKTIGDLRARGIDVEAIDFDSVGKRGVSVLADGVKNAFGENSAEYKLATDIEERLASGKKVTNYQIGQLVTALANEISARGYEGNAFEALRQVQQIAELADVYEQTNANAADAGLEYEDKTGEAADAGRDVPAGRDMPAARYAQDARDMSAGADENGAPSVVSVEGEVGSRTFTLSNGETVSAADLKKRAADVPSSMVAAYAGLADDVRLANAVIENYEGAASPDEATAYLKRMVAVYKTGVEGLDSSDAFAAATNGRYTLPVRAVEAAYKAGLQAVSENDVVKYPTYTKQDIDNNIVKLASAESVYDVPAERLERTGLSPREMFMNYFNSLGNVIRSKVFGRISLPKSSARSEVKHGSTAQKLASIEAIPAVIDNGDVINYLKKERGAERIVVAAPIKIGNDPYYMGVMLKRDGNGQRLYIHDVVLEEEGSRSSGAILVTTGTADEEGHLFLTNILQNALDVKHGMKNSADAENAADFGENTKSAESGDDGRSAADVESAKVESEKTSPRSADADSVPAAVREGAEGGTAGDALSETREGKKSAERVDRAAERSDSKKASARADAMSDDMKVVIDVYAKAMGVDVRTVLELPDGAYGKIELAARSIITLAANSRNALSTLIHEDVHLIAALDADAYEDMREVALRYLKETGADVKALVGEKMEAHKSEISGMKPSEQRAYCEEEVVADAYGAIQNAPNASERIARVLSSLGYTETEAKTLRDKIVGIFSKLRDAFRRLLNSLRSANGGDTVAASKAEAWINSSIEACDAMLDAWSDAHYAIDDARRSGRLDGVKAKGVRHMIVKDASGKRVSVVTQNILADKTISELKAVENFLKSEIGKDYEIARYAHTVYIGKDLPSEYLYSNYTKNLAKYDPKTLTVKKLAARNIGEMIRIASDERYANNMKSKHNVDAKYGWYKYTTRIGIPIFDHKGTLDHVNQYTAELVVRHDADGGRYLYDIIDIKKETKSSTLQATYISKLRNIISKSSFDSISQPGGNVKTQKVDSVDEIRELEKKLKEREKKIGRLEGKVKEQRTLLSSLKRGLDVFKASIPSYSEVESFVEQYVSDSHSDKQLGRAGKTKLIGQLIEAMQTLKAADNSTDYAAAYNKFREAAKSIVDNASREGSEYSGDVPYKEIVNTVNRLYVPEEMRGDVRYFRDGKWGDIYKHFHDHGLTLTSDSTAMSADMIVREMSEQFPEFFSESVNDWSTEGGALVSLLDLYDRSWEALHEKYNPFFESPSWSDDDTSYGMDMTIEHLGSREAAVNEVYDSVARDLMRGMANVKDVKTVDGAYREAYAEAQRYFNDTVERINEQHRNAMREFRLSTTRDANARIEATREYLRTGELHDKVRRQVKRLQKKVVETRKHNMPVDLLDIGLGMLDVLRPGYNLTTEAGRKFQILKNNLQMWRLLRGNPENLASVQLTDDEAARMDGYMNELEDIIDEAEKTVNGTLISKMDFRQSEKVYDLIRKFIEVMNNATEQVGAAERRSNMESATKAAAEVKANVTKTAFGQNYMLFTRAAWRILEFIGGYDDHSYFKGLSDDIRARERSANKWWSDARHPFNRLMGADEYRDMSRAERREYKKKYKQFVSEYVDVGFVDVNGHAVKFTHAQLAQIYMTHLREEASNGRESHLFDGGIEVAPNEDLEVGRTSFERQELQRVRHVDAEMIDRIEKELTDFDREFIAAAQQFFDRVSYDELNKVHMALFGVPLPKSKNYITYMVDRGFVKDQSSVDIKNLRENRMLENSGRYKQTTAHSPAPLIITSLPEVIDAMMDEVRQQMSYAIPNRNFLKINNLIVNQETGESVNRLLNSRWRNIAGSGPVKGLFGKGKGTAKGVNVVMQLMTDLQTPRQRDDSFFDRATNKMITSTLYTNISVGLKQLASITNTGLYLGQKAVTSIWGRLPYVMKNYRTIIAEIDEHTGAHAIRRAGYSIPEFDAAKNKAPLAEKIPGHNLIQYNDCIATAAIWLGCKTEVNGTLKSSGIERGSEAYWKAVTDLYNRVIEETQPMYSTLYRSEMQKSTNAVMRYSYMFRTQQMQEYGIVMSALNEQSAKNTRAAASAKAAEEAERAYRAADADHKESAREAWEDAKADAQKASDEAKAARKKFRHAVGSTMRATVTITVLSAIINAILRRNKDWKDENGEITLESFLEAQGSNFLENIFSFMAPVLAPIGAWEVGEDVVDAIKGEKISASGLDFNNAPFYELVKKFAKAGYGTLNSVSALRKSIDNETFAKEFDESLGHYFETFVLGKESDNVALSMAGSLRNVLKTLADISGIPGSNIDAYIQATRNWYTDIKNGDFGKFEADANRTAAQNYNIVFDALVSGDADKADEYKAKAEELGKNDDDFNTEMKKRLKERFAETGEIDPDGGNRDEIIDRYTELGFRDYVVADAVDDVFSEDEEKVDSPYSDNEVYRAVVDGDAAKLDEIADWYRTNGYNLPRTKLSKEFRSVWERFDSEEKEQIKDMLINHFGYDEKYKFYEWEYDFTPYKSVVSAAGAKIADGDLSTLSNDALDFMKNYAENQVSIGVEKEKARENAASYVKNTEYGFGAYLKEAYVSGNAATRQAIRRAMSDMRDLDGKRLYGTYSDIVDKTNKWLKG